MSFGPELIVGLFAISLALMGGGMHRVNEGHVGAYYRFGVLQSQLTQPGYNFMIPLITRYEEVQVSVQTDEVRDIPCGTSGGVLVYFDKIEVVNRLNQKFVYQTLQNYTVNYDKIWIFDKIHHEINQFCSKHTLQQIYIDKFDKLDEELIAQLKKDLVHWAPGIDILAIRVTKPKIPESIRRNFEEMEAQRTQYLIVSERQNVLLQEASSKQSKQIIEAQSLLEVAKVNIQRQIQEKQKEQEIVKIQSEMEFNQEKANTDSEFYIQQKQIESQKLRLTKEYLNYIALDALTSNITLYFGNQIPNIQIKGKLE